MNGLTAGGAQALAKAGAMRPVSPGRGSAPRLAILPSLVIGADAPEYWPKVTRNRLAKLLDKEFPKLSVDRSNFDRPARVATGQFSQVWLGRRPNTSFLSKTAKARQVRFVLLYRVKVDEQEAGGLPPEYYAAHVVYLFDARTQKLNQASGYGQIGENWVDALVKSTRRVLKNKQMGKEFLSPGAIQALAKAGAMRPVSPGRGSAPRLEILPSLLIGTDAPDYKPKFTRNRLAKVLDKEFPKISVYLPDFDRPAHVAIGRFSQYWLGRRPSTSFLLKTAKERQVRFVLLYRVKLEEEYARYTLLGYYATHVVYLFDAHTQDLYEASGYGQLGENWEDALVKSARRVMENVR